MKIQRYRKQVVFAADLIITVFSCILLFTLLPYENGTHSRELFLVFPNLIVLIVCFIVGQISTQSYNSLWRYAGSREYLRLLLGGTFGFTLYLVVDAVLLDTPISLLFSIATYTVSFIGMMCMRFLYRIYRMRKQTQPKDNKRMIAIIGAGDAGVTLLREIELDPQSRYRVYCFFDDSQAKIGKWIDGVEVKGPVSHLPELLTNTPVYDLILAMPSANVDRRKEILDICARTQCRVQTLPNTLELLFREKGHLVHQVRDVRIDDLLGREPIRFDVTQIAPMLSNKTVLVTGGGGSIGSELCRQIAEAKPEKLIIFDIYENNAYDIQQELRYRYGNSLDLAVEIASIRDREKVNAVFDRYRPQIVFHTAAHKHVPLMEQCPVEAVKNNIFGTYYVACAAERFGAEQFVQISTDKAVNPTNIMGATKCFCEMMLQCINQTSRTQFVVVRFGNVLGSNGSVIPLFQRQIRAGGPVTITDRRIIRYFMTIPEAVQLVLQSAAMAEDGEVFVLDMGDPVKIIDLAENLIRLSGHTPYQDIEIIETGLRPGEKLYEELLIAGSHLKKTQNDKIFVEWQVAITMQDLQRKLDLLRKVLKTNDSDQVRIILRQVVPSYKTPEEINGENIPELNYNKVIAEQGVTEKAAASC